MRTLQIGPKGCFLSYIGGEVSSESQSLFGQADVPLGETLTVVGGIRFTKNGRDGTYRNVGVFFNRKVDNCNWQFGSPPTYGDRLGFDC